MKSNYLLKIYLAVCLQFLIGNVFFSAGFYFVDHI